MVFFFLSFLSSFMYQNHVLRFKLFFLSGYYLLSLLYEVMEYVILETQLLLMDSSF